MRLLGAGGLGKSGVSCAASAASFAFPNLRRQLRRRPRLSKRVATRVFSGVTEAKADERLNEIEMLYRNRFQHFLRVALAITGDYECALDAVQEGFGNAIRSRGRYRGEAPLEAWVWRAVVNASRDTARVRRSHDAVSDDLVATSNGHAPSTSADLRAALASLSERQRLMLFLRHYADLDYRSIAAALGVSGGTVSATLSQAHARLRFVLEEVRLL
jgi:RNA polymerase sigma factor (sigma-70 family)